MVTSSYFYVRSEIIEGFQDKEMRFLCHRQLKKNNKLWVRSIAVPGSASKSVCNARYAGSVVKES
jgi:hypothetical protein